MPEHRGGPPGLMPNGRSQPHPGGPAGERMRENMERHMMQGRDASVPPPFAAMGDAGVRRRHRPVLTPEQLAKRNEQLAKLHAKFGHQFLEGREARMELNTYAWRIARLRRMRTLAEQQGKSKLIERIDALMKKENERHEMRMERLRGGDGGLVPPTHPKPIHPASSASKMGGQP